MADASDFDGYQFCGIAEHIATGAVAAYWPEAPVTWNIRDNLPRLSVADVKAAFLLGVESWERVCGIDLRYTANGKTANILLTVANLGGPSGVLADSHLVPPGLRKNADFQATQRYDSSESWTIAENPAPGTIDIVRVAAHEIGHAIGSPHGGEGLMKPTYSTKIRFPQPGYDTEFAQRGYGPPKPDQPPEPTPPTPGPKNARVIAEWDAAGRLIRAEISPGARITFLPGHGTGS